MGNIFSERLTDLIKNSGKKQKEICEEIKVSKQKLSKWKTGYNEPSIDDLIALANAFECSVDYLLGREDDFGNIVMPTDENEKNDIIQLFSKLSDERKNIAKSVLKDMANAEKVK